MPDDLTKKATEHKQEVIRVTDKSSAEIVQSYETTWKAIQRELDKLYDALKTAQEEGESAAQLIARIDRQKNLETQVIEALSEFSGETLAQVNKDLQAAVEMGASHQQEELQTVAPSVTFGRLPKSGIEEITGTLKVSRDFMSDIPDATWNIVKDTLTSGLALGKSMAAIAAEVRQAAGLPLSRALTIARTEVIRGYRESSHQTRLKNQDVLDGWVWSATLKQSTCPICWAMHGTRHPLTERLEDHPSGRCASIPLVKGFPVDISPTAGEDAFAQLTPDQQERILGPQRMEAYKQGFKLRDLIQPEPRPPWGTGYAKVPLKKLWSIEQAPVTSWDKDELQKRRAKVVDLIATSAHRGPGRIKRLQDELDEIDRRLKQIDAPPPPPPKPTEKPTPTPTGGGEAQKKLDAIKKEIRDVGLKLKKPGASPELVTRMEELIKERRKYRRLARKESGGGEPPAKPAPKEPKAPKVKPPKPEKELTLRQKDKLRQAAQAKAMEEYAMRNVPPAIPRRANLDTAAIRREIFRLAREDYNTPEWMRTPGQDSAREKMYKAMFDRWKFEPTTLPPSRTKGVLDKYWRQNIDIGWNAFQRIIGEKALRSAMKHARKTYTGAREDADIHGYPSVLPGANGRAYYGDYAQFVASDPRTDTRTYVHEFGHWLEYHGPGVMRRAHEFLEQRTKGEKFQQLRKLTGNPGYSADEEAKPDRFIHPYMGKKAAMGRSTELISMGIEMLWNDPVKLARDDPEYFDFLLQLLADINEMPEDEL